MSKELEVKFLLSKPEVFISRLDNLGAKLESERTHEYNLRFDTPDRALTRSFQVLRLRQDARVRVTYKGPGKISGGVRARQEIEFGVDDFEAARAMLEALSYEISFIYEKYRSTYHLDNVEIVVDETPLGTFTEIEGPDAGAIQLATAHLGLDWESRIVESYAYLFETAKRSLALPFRDLTFENFEGVPVSPNALGVKIGD
ncbi:MAG TPA: class IV adenylate cyclase [Anaerolineales bacterium]|nr:class IV adenylate cyclase [Anaerolineales bacterium]